MAEDIDVFEGKTFAELLKDIHDNALDKRKKIDGVVAQLVPLIHNAGDAMLIGPIIREFFDVGVKNDEQIIKIATIIQRIIAAKSANSSSDDDGSILSDVEKEKLIKSVLEQEQELATEIDKVVNKAEFISGTHS